MSTPTTAMLHMSQPLTNISVAYMQNPDDFVANKVFPVVPVEKEFDKYYVYDRASFIKNKMAKRANGTESQGDGFTLSSDSYACETWSLHKDVTDRDRANQDGPLNLDRDVTQFLSHQGLISAEINWATEFFGTSIWGTDLTGIASGSPSGSQFLRWDVTSSTPFIDIANAKAQVMLASGGFEPNTMVLGYQTYIKLAQHPELIDRVKSVVTSNSQGNNITTLDAMDLAKAFGVTRVLVMKGVYNAANEGVAASNAFIGGKHALLCYTAPRPGIMQPSAGYTFAWRGMGNNDAGVAIGKFRMPHLGADRIEIEAAYDFKKVGAELGYFFASAVS